MRLCRLLSLVFALVCWLGAGAAQAATAVAVVTSGIGPGGTTLPMALGIAQGGQFFYSYDSVSCASLPPGTVSTVTAPVVGGLTTAAATQTIPAGSPCAGQSMAGMMVTYTPNIGIPDQGALLTAGGNYWECGGSAVSTSYQDCANRASATKCAPGNPGSKFNCQITSCSSNPIYGQGSIIGAAYCQLWDNYTFFGQLYYEHIQLPFYEYSGLSASCTSNYAGSVTASGCTNPAPIVSPYQLDPTKQDYFTAKYTSADGTATTTGSITMQPAGKNLGTCNCTTGDPISIGTGNMYDAVVDYTTSGQNPLSFVRSYNSQAITAGFAATIGTGWRSNYDRYLHKISATAMAAERPDGKILQFVYIGGAWVGDGDMDMILTQSGASWLLTDHDQTVETYTLPIANGVGSGNSGFGLQSIKARNGYTQTMGYNGSNQLATITDSYGRVLTLGYSGGLLSTVTTPDSTTITLTRTGKLLTGVTYSGSPATSLVYGYTNSFLTSVTDQLGVLYATWTYDAYGRATSNHMGTGTAGTTGIVYNADGSRTVTGPLGLVETYKFTTSQGSQKLVEVDRAASSTTPAATRTLSYDVNGYLYSQTDWLGLTTSWARDIHGNPNTIIDPLGQWTTFTYNPTFNLPATIAAPGITTAFTYDAVGEVLTKAETDTNGNASNGQVRTTTYTWSNALLASVQLPRSDLVVKTQFTYVNGALTQITDPLGHLTKVTAHTGGGRPLTMLDPNSVTTTFTYDTRQRPLTQAVATSGGTRTTTRTYDAAGNLTRLTQPDGSYTGYSYDSAHRVTGMTDNAGDKIAYTLDNAGNATATSIAPATGPATASSAATFDAIGRRLTETPSGSGHATSWTYDVDGNVKTVTDGLNHVTTYTTYDALNRLTLLTLPDTSTQSFTYDPLNHKTVYKTSTGVETDFYYDAWGDVLKRYSAPDGNYTYVYDADGNLTKQTDAYNYITNLTYDAGDRPLTKVLPADAAETVTWTYDQTGTGFSFGIGRLTGMTDQAGSLTRAYDERGNLLTQTRTTGSGATLHSFVTGRTYDAASRVATLTYPTGIALTYTRNALGQVTAISENGTGVISAATYLPFGPLAGLTYGNGVTETLAYDASYRATGVTDTGTAGLVAKLTYTLDAADNVSSIADGATPANNQSFTYNTRDRLLTASGAYGGYTWAYDYNGNRSSEQLGANTAISYGYSSDRLTSVGSTNLGWLNDGVIAGITPSSGPASSFIINYGDRLLQSTIGGVGVETNLYDGMGDLFSRSTAGPPVTAYQYHYDLDGALLEEDTNNAGEADYIWLGSRPVAVYNPPSGTLSYIHADRLGTPVKATNAAQGTVWTASYLPFGQATITGTIQMNLRLPGMFAGPIGGYYHNGARDYDYTKGRYNESDPINRWGSFNIYAYAEGNPLKLIDPSGLQGESYFTQARNWLAENQNDINYNLGGIPYAFPEIGIGEAAVLGLAADGTASAAAAEAATSAATSAEICEGSASTIAKTSAQLGQEGEDAVRSQFDIGLKQRIDMEDGSYRIPDGITLTAVSEVKNVGYLGLTQQLLDYSDYAQATGRVLNIYIRPTTITSGPLQCAIDCGLINRFYIPQ